MEGDVGLMAAPQKLTLTGPGLCLEYWPVLNPPPQSCQICLVVTPHQTELDRVDWQQDCQGCRSLLIIQVNLDELEASIAAQFAALPLPLNQRKTLSDPALLHLIQLLHQEMQAPQPMSQLLMASIVKVLISDLVVASTQSVIREAADCDFEQRPERSFQGAVGGFQSVSPPESRREYSF